MVEETSRLLVGELRRIFNEAIAALLGDVPIDERLARARALLEQLEQHANELDPRLLGELRGIIADTTWKREQRTDGGKRLPLSSEDEGELTERLLSLYLDASDGMLIP